MSSRRSRRGNFTKGRIWLVCIFLLLRGLDVFMYFSAMHKHEILGAIINSTIWSTALLAAIWCRKSWARYAMVVLTLISVGLSLIFEASFAEFVAGSNLVTMAIITAGYLAVALILILSPSIQKLTSKSYV